MRSKKKMHKRLKMKCDNFKRQIRKLIGKKYNKNNYMGAFAASINKNAALRLMTK